MKPVRANTDRTPQPLSRSLLVRKSSPKKPASVSSRPGWGHPKLALAAAVAALKISVSDNKP